MLSYVSGNLFESPAQTLVNTVNTVGVMGKGIALTFKSLFPDMFREYQCLCERGQLRIGSLHVFPTDTKIILNFPTKQHWRNPSKLEYIEAGLQTFAATYEHAGIHSVAFPPLGCGNGELDFSAVRPLMERYLEPLPIRVYIYAPLPRAFVPEHRSAEEMSAWLRASPAFLALDEVWEDLREYFRERRVVETIARARQFEVESATDSPDELRLWTPGRQFRLSKDDFQELWAQLREYGTVTSASVPVQLELRAPYMMGILNVLPYVKTLQMASTFDELRSNTTRALQLIPTEDGSGPQRELVLV
jgi:O-acetyl-ADP-ribose deacetylase (regulator of RNase III)